MRRDPLFPTNPTRHQGVLPRIPFPAVSFPQETGDRILKRLNYADSDSLAGFRILLVEDNELNMEIMIEILQEKKAIVEIRAQRNNRHCLRVFTPTGADLLRRLISV